MFFVDAVRRPLSRPYEGPFRVLQRDAKSFVISRAGRSWTVSVDRLKPALGFEPGVLSPAAASRPILDRLGAPDVAPRAAAAASPATAPSYADIVTTRSGRVSRPPTRL